MSNVKIEEKVNNFKAFLNSDLTSEFIPAEGKYNDNYIIVKIPFGKNIYQIRIASYYNVSSEDIKLNIAGYYNANNETIYYPTYWLNHYFGILSSEEIPNLKRKDYLEEFKLIVLNKIKEICNNEFPTYKSDNIDNYLKKKGVTFKEEIVTSNFTKDVEIAFVRNEETPTDYFVIDPKTYENLVLIKDSLKYLEDKNYLDIFVENLLHKKDDWSGLDWEDRLYFSYWRRVLQIGYIEKIKLNPKDYKNLYIMKGIYNACQDKSSIKAILNINGNIIETKLQAEPLTRIVYTGYISSFEIPASDRDKVKNSLEHRWDDILPKYIEKLIYRGKVVYDKTDIMLLCDNISE